MSGLSLCAVSLSLVVVPILQLFDSVRREEGGGRREEGGGRREEGGERAIGDGWLHVHGGHGGEGHEGEGCAGGGVCRGRDAQEEGCAEGGA